MMIAQDTSNCAVLTCKDRVRSAQYAIKYLGAEVLVMDDGFSNRKIYKDLTILAVDSERRFGNGHILPLGPNREPISEIGRANKLLIISKVPNIDVDWARIYQKPLHVCQFKPGSFYNLKNLATAKPKKQKVVAFCGIGQPESFYNYLTQYFEVVKTIDYKDHHEYTQKDIENLIQTARENGANTFVTTEKDAVKLKTLAIDLSFDILVLKLKPILDIEAILNDRRNKES
jgi:tetraacyldisaccharide 4'-kinase